MTLTEFLRDRITEDEAMAFASAVRRPAPLATLNADMSKARRALAKCTSMRQIVDVHDGWHECAYIRDGGERGLTDFDANGEAEGMRPCQTLTLLGLPYADHHDYDERWKP